MQYNTVNIVIRLLSESDSPFMGVAHVIDRPTLQGTIATILSLSNTLNRLGFNEGSATSNVIIRFTLPHLPY